MTANIPSAINIGSDDSLMFNIDGEFFTFSSASKTTNIETVTKYVSGYRVPAGNVSSRKYLVPLTFLDKVVKADRVVAKVIFDIKYQASI